MRPTQTPRTTDEELQCLQHAVDELSVINEIVTAIGTHRKLDTVNKLILTKCVRHFDVEQGVIHLIDKSDPEDLLRTAVHLKTQERVVSASSSMPLRLEIDLVGYIQKYKKPLLSNDFQADGRFKRAREDLPDIRSVLAVPLMIRNEIIGVLSLFNRHNAVPFEASDERCLAIIAMPAAQVIENSRLYEMEENLRAAQAVQKHLLPKETPKIAGLDLYGFSTPAYEVGGDYFDWLELPGGRVGCIVADVSGKGIAAALLMAELQGAFRALAHTLQHPEHILDTVNRFLGERMEPDRFVTLFYVVVDPMRNELIYVNAGHNPAFLRRRDGSVELLSEGGLMLSVISKKPYAAYRVPLQEGDCLVVYTDGITDAESSSGQQWGEGNLRDVVQRVETTTAQSVAEQLRSELRSFVGSGDQPDDMTLAVIVRTSR